MASKLGWFAWFGLWILLLVIVGEVDPHSDYDRYRSDLYGEYSYDRSGYKIYRRCYNRRTYPRDNCKERRDTWRPNTNTGAQRGINVGRGRFRVFGRDAELTCEFPRGNHIVSNVIWERVRDRYYSHRYTDLRDWLGNRMQIRRLRDYGTTLVIRNWSDRDAGVYRCIATREHDAYGHNYGYRPTETIYMEVDFFPHQDRGYRYDDHFNDDRYRGNDYYPSHNTGYSYQRYGRVAYLEESKDTIVSKDVRQRENEDAVIAV